MTCASLLSLFYAQTFKSGLLLLCQDIRNLKKGLGKLGPVVVVVVVLVVVVVVLASPPCRFSLSVLLWLLSLLMQLQCSSKLNGFCHL